MKNLWKPLLFALVATATVYSCSKEVDAPVDEQPVSEPVTNVVKFKAEITDPSTKATLEANAEDTKFLAAWENALDKINLAASSNSFIDEAPAEWDESEKCFVASFTSETPTVDEDWEYEAIYPYVDGGNIPFGSERTQNGNAYNSAFDVMYGTQIYSGTRLGKDEEGKNFVIPMNRLTGIAYFHITGGPDEDVVSATLSVQSGNIAATSVSVASGAITPTGATNSITITFPSEAPKASNLQLWFNVLPGSYTGLKLTIVTTNKVSYLQSKGTMTYTAGKINKVVLSDLAWTNKAVTPSVSVVNVDNVNAVKEMGNGSYGDYKDNAQTITVDGLEYSMMNICANTKDGNTGYMMAAKQFIQMKKNTSYILNTKSGVTNVKAWVLPKTTEAISVYQGTTSENISTLINDPNKTTETVKLISNSDNEVDTQLDVYEYTITDGFFKLAPSATLWLYKLEVTYSNGGSSEGGSDPEKLAPPSVRCTAKTETSLTFSWNEDAHANGYQVSTDGGETYSSTQAVTTYTWTGLEASTSYTLYVKAIGDGTNYTNSDAASAEGKTTSGVVEKEQKTATITFGTNNVKIDKASVTAADDCNNSWTITTVGTTSFTANAGYYQVGKKTEPATSITFTTTLPSDAEVGSIEAKFGGFSETAGTVALKVGDTSVGSGSLNETNDVTVSSTSTAAGNVVTVSITGISRGVKCYNIKVGYKTAK